MYKYNYPGAFFRMSGKKGKKSAKAASASSKKKKDSKKPKTELVVARSDDLREIVTETVTKLLAEDVLEMDEDGIIDIKRAEKKKDKNKKKKKD